LARAPDERITIAKEMYESGTALIEIANHLNIPEGTIRSWKNRGKWQRNENCNATDNKKRNVAKKKSVSNRKREVVATEVEQVIDNPDLTDKQRLFCILYVKYRNKTKAYQKAYGASWETANAHAYELWDNVGIRKEIDRLLSEYRAEIGLDIKDLFQWYLDIARADINDYVAFGQREIKYTDKKGNEQAKTVNFVDLNNSDNLDGTIISEVSQGKDGIKIKFADKMKAMQWLGEHIDLADEKQRAEIAILKAKANDEEDSKEIKNVENVLISIKKTAKSLNKKDDS